MSHTLRHARVRLIELLQLLAEVIESEEPYVGIIVFHNNGGIKLASAEITDDVESVKATVKFLDQHGHDATVDGVPEWSSSDTSVASIEEADDGMSAEVFVEGPGVTLINVKATNEDGSTAEAQGTLTIKAGEAVIGEVTFEGAEGNPPSPPDETAPPAEESPPADSGSETSDTGTVDTGSEPAPA